MIVKLLICELNAYWISLTRQNVLIETIQSLIVYINLLNDISKFPMEKYTYVFVLLECIILLSYNCNLEQSDECCGVVFKLIL